MKKRNLVIKLTLVTLLFAITACNSKKKDADNTDQNKPQTGESPSKIDNYYTDMKFTIDSFQVFLAGYNESEIKNMTQVASIKTGDNPFETLYKNPPAGESTNFIKVTNNTPYDMVLLENNVVYDSIKMPLSAHFIKKGAKLEINFNRSDTKTIFNVYIGKKWATFQTGSKNIFIRSESAVEYRFSELAPDAKSILETDYSFPNDAVISYSKGGLDIDSKGAMINPLSKK